MRKFNHWISTMTAVLLLAAVGTGCSARMKASYHLHRAEEYFNAGKYQDASIEYQKVLRDAPDNAQAWSRLGIIYFNQGRPLEAFPILVKAAQLDTNNLELRLKLGMVYLALGKTKEARDEVGFVLDQNPQDPQAPLLLADASVTSNEIAAARQRLQRLSQKGETAPLDVALGILAFHQHDPKTAETFFKLATARDPKFSDAYSELGNIYLLEHDLKQADAALKKAADLAPVSSGKGVRYAQFKILTGDPATGKKLLQALVKKDPGYLPAWIALAQLAAAEKKYDDSFTLVGNVLSRDPRNLEGLILKAHLELLQGKTAQAVTDLEGTSRMFPKSPVVLYQLAMAYLANQQSDKAIGSLNQALNLNPKFAEATLLLAQLQIRSGNADSATASLRQLLQQEPGLRQAQLLLADAYRAQGSPDNAIRIYEELEKSYPTNSEVPLLLGVTYLQQKQNAEARAEFEKALRLAPDSLSALQQLVSLDVSEKQYTAARQRVQQQVEKHPKSPELQLLLGQVLAAQGETNQAEATLSKSIELQPDSQAGYLMLAQLYDAAGQDAKALTQLQTLLGKDPQNASALMLMGIIKNSEKDYVGARDAYEKLVAADTNNAVALNNLACVYADHLNQLDQAYQLARQARNLAPADPAIADTLGWILFRQGQYAAALDPLEQGADKLYRMPTVQFHLGMAYYMMGDEAEAKAAFQRALQLKQDFPEQAECRQRLAILAIDPQTAGTKTRVWLEDWTAKNPGDSIALLRLAALYRREGLTDKAIAAYEAAAKASPQNLAVMKNLAVLYASKDPAKALTWANAAYKLAPNDPGITHLLGRLNFQTGDYSWALTLLQLTAQAQPMDPSVLYDLGEAYYSMGRVDEARTAMQNALNNGNNFVQSSEAKRFLAMTDLANRPSQAVAMQAQVQETLKAFPNYVPALMVEAVIAEQQTNLPTAERIYTDVLKRYPDFAPAQEQLAILLSNNPENDSGAYPLAVKAHAAFPNNPEVAKALGIIVFRQGDYARAVELLRDSAHQMHQDPEVLYFLGMAQYHLNHREECKSALQKALNLHLAGRQAASAEQVLAELK
jgi:Flp pilus assembly protein TadD